MKQQMFHTFSHKKRGEGIVASRNICEKFDDKNPFSRFSRKFLRKLLCKKGMKKFVAKCSKSEEEGDGGGDGGEAVRAQLRSKVIIAPIPESAHALC